MASFANDVGIEELQAALGDLPPHQAPQERYVKNRTCLRPKERRRNEFFSAKRFEARFAYGGYEEDVGVNNEHLSGLPNLPNEGDPIWHGIPRPSLLRTGRKGKGLALGGIAQVVFLDEVLRPYLPGAEAA